MLSCSIWFSAPSFWMGGGLESRCVGRVYGVDGARHHPHLTHDPRSLGCDESYDSDKEALPKNAYMYRAVGSTIERILAKRIRKKLS